MQFVPIGSIDNMLHCFREWFVTASILMSWFHPASSPNINVYNVPFAAAFCFQNFLCRRRWHKVWIFMWMAYHKSGNSIANVLGLLQSSAKPSPWAVDYRSWPSEITGIIYKPLASKWQTACKICIKNTVWWYQPITLGDPSLQAPNRGL